MTRNTRISLLEITTNNKLKTDKVETTSVTYENIIRLPGESDFAFLKRISGEIGFEAFVQGDSLYFRKPKDTSKGQSHSERLGYHQLSSHNERYGCGK